MMQLKQMFKIQNWAAILPHGDNIIPYGESAHP